jgi:hypothetical protein
LPIALHNLGYHSPSARNFTGNLQVLLLIMNRSSGLPLFDWSFANSTRQGMVETALVPAMNRCRGHSPGGRPKVWPEAFREPLSALALHNVGYRLLNPVVEEA